MFNRPVLTVSVIQAKEPEVIFSTFPKESLLDVAWHYSDTPKVFHGSVADFVEIEQGFQLIAHDCVVYTVLAVPVITDMIKLHMTVTKTTINNIVALGKTALPEDRAADWVLNMIQRDAQSRIMENQERHKIENLVIAYHTIYGHPFVRFECGAKSAGLERAIAEFELKHQTTFDLSSVKVYTDDLKLRAVALGNSLLAASRDDDKEDFWSLVGETPHTVPGALALALELELLKLDDVWEEIDRNVGAGTRDGMLMAIENRQAELTEALAGTR